MRRLWTLGVVLSASVLLTLTIGCGGGTTNPDDDDPTETSLAAVVAVAGQVSAGQLQAGKAGLNVLVTDANDNPITGVTVYLTTVAMTNAGGLTAYPHATTTANGQVGFRQIPLDGNLRLRMTLPNRGSAVQAAGDMASGVVGAATIKDN
jgi:hypothetical protein